MKKILIVGLTPPNEGGSQQHLLELVKRFNDKKFKVTLLTQKGSVCKKYVKTIEIPIREEVGYAQSIDFYNGVKEKMQDLGQYDIVHIHESYLFPQINDFKSWCGTYGNKRYIPPKVILTVHGLKGFKFYDMKLIWMYFERVMGKADAFIAVSPEVEKTLTYSFPHRIKFIPNGVDTSLYKKAKKKNQVAFIGRCHEQKGIRYLIEAMGQLPQTKLVIIGKTNDYLAGLIEESEADIEAMGYLSDRKKIAKVLSESKVIALPSLWEGLPLTLFEGLASGTPVVATRISAFEEVIEDGVNGALVTPESSDHLKSTIEYLLENPRVAIEMGKKGKATAQRYDWGNIVKQTEDFYGEILK